jgi:hypothetical protein
VSAFTTAELAYLQGERRLARLATVGSDGTPPHPGRQAAAVHGSASCYPRPSSRVLSQ